MFYWILGSALFSLLLFLEIGIKELLRLDVISLIVTILTFLFSLRISVKLSNSTDQLIKEFNKISFRKTISSTCLLRVEEIEKHIEYLKLVPIQTLTNVPIQDFINFNLKKKKALLFISEVENQVNNVFLSVKIEGVTDCLIEAKVKSRNFDVSYEDFIDPMLHAAYIIEIISVEPGFGLTKGDELVLSVGSEPLKELPTPFNLSSLDLLIQFECYINEKLQQEIPCNYTKEDFKFKV